MINIYGHYGDLFVDKVVNMCHRLGLEHEVKSVALEGNLEYLYNRGHMSTPQIFDDDVHIGSCNDLVEYIELVTHLEERRITA